jgi:hypothetical protein
MKSVSIFAIVLGLANVAFAAGPLYTCESAASQAQGLDGKLTIELTNSSTLKLVDFYSETHQNLSIRENPVQPQDLTPGWMDFTRETGCVPTNNNPMPHCFAISIIDIQVSPEILKSEILGEISYMGETYNCEMNLEVMHYN